MGGRGRKRAVPIHPGQWMQVLDRQLYWIQAVQAASGGFLPSFAFLNGSLPFLTSPLFGVTDLFVLRLTGLKHNQHDSKSPVINKSCPLGAEHG